MSFDDIVYSTAYRSLPTQTANTVSAASRPSKIVASGRQNSRGGVLRLRAGRVVALHDRLEIAQQIRQSSRSADAAPSRFRSAAD